MKSLPLAIARYAPMQTRLLLTLALFATVASSNAEPDLLNSNMDLPTSSPTNNLIAPGEARPEPAPPKITPAQAANLVRRATGGQVMNVSSQQTDNGLIYGVKVLNNGRMRIIQVDANSGQMLNN